MLGCQPSSLRAWQETKGNSNTCLADNHSVLTLIQIMDFATKKLFVTKTSPCRAGKILLSGMNDCLQLCRSLVYPSVWHKFGPYDEVDSDLAQLLNFDFRLQSNLLRLVLDLFSGRIVQSGTTNFIVIYEVHSLHTSTDIHSELSGAFLLRRERT